VAEDKEKEKPEEKTRIIKRNWIIILILLLVAGWFYWFQLRPAKIRQRCSQEALEKAQLLLKEKAGMVGGEYEEPAERDLYLQGDYKWQYEKCLHEKGLK